MTPKGYLPLRDAIDRCIQQWSCTGDEVWEKLRPYLHAGEISGCVRYASGETKQISEAWGAEINDSAHLDGKLKFESQRLDGPHSVACFVNISELEVMLDGIAPDGGPAKSARGGAPPKFDRDLFLIDAFKILYDNKTPPKSPSDLRKKALDAFAQRGLGVPSDDWARKSIKLLWKELELGAPDLEEPG